MKVKTTREEVLESLQEYISERSFGEYEPCEIKESIDLSKDLGFDSLDRIELIIYAENRFSIIINDENAEELKTIKEIVDYTYNIVSNQ